LALDKQNFRLSRDRSGQRCRLQGRKIIGPPRAFALGAVGPDGVTWALDRGFAVYKSRPPVYRPSPESRINVSAALEKHHFRPLKLT